MHQHSWQSLPRKSRHIQWLCCKKPPHHAILSIFHYKWLRHQCVRSGPSDECQNPTNDFGNCCWRKVSMLAWGKRLWQASKHFELSQSFVGPQSFTISTVLQTFIIVFDCTNIVSLAHALISPLTAFFRRDCFFRLLPFSLLQVSLHREEFGIVPGHNGIALFFGICIRLPVLPGLAVLWMA